jgi:N-acetylmuramic acid 6-phosphate etherase
MDNFEYLSTESINQNTVDIDKHDIGEILRIMNKEDASVAAAVGATIDHIEIAVNEIVKSFNKGGRLIYVGAGTSGRIGVMDAVECPPTFGVSPEMVQACMAGGKDAFFRSAEGAEDDIDGGRKLVDDLCVNSCDVLVGITASGRTPFVVGAISAARKAGAFTIGISNNPDSVVKHISDLDISPVVGPEVITGSTRLKAGTSQKMILNMLTTTAMIKIGKVYGNLMVEMNPSNDKLYDRMHRIIVQATQASDDCVENAIKRSGAHINKAIIMIKTGMNVDEAEEKLQKHGGNISTVIDEYNSLSESHGEQRNKAGMHNH